MKNHKKRTSTHLFRIITSKGMLHIKMNLAKAIMKSIYGYSAVASVDKILA
jgi:hypothetical protein